MAKPSRPDGSTRLAPNGYHYTKRDGKWYLTHHLLAEELVGRPVNTKTDGVYFRDGDKTNLTIGNIGIRTKKTITLPTKLARLYAKRDDILAQIAELEGRLGT